MAFYSSKSLLLSVRYKVIEILAGGSCALVEWKLETGRTHQVHIFRNSREILIGKILLQVREPKGVV